MEEPLCFFPEGQPQRHDHGPCYATTSKQRGQARAPRCQPPMRTFRSVDVLLPEPAAILTPQVAAAPTQGVPQDRPRGTTAVIRSRAAAPPATVPAVASPA